MINKIQDWSAFAFILTITILGIVSFAGIWNLLDEDIVSKSIQTLSVLTLAFIVLLTSGRFLSKETEISIPNPLFKQIRNITVGATIIGVVLLAFAGVLAIWDIIAIEKVLYKTIGSIATLMFSSLVIVSTCLQREGSTLFRNRSLSIGSIVSVFILITIGLFIVEIFG